MSANLKKKISLNACIAHDWFSSFTGAERVVAEITPMFEKATIYTLFDFLSADERLLISGGHPVVVSRLNNLPGVKRYYRYLLLQGIREIEYFDIRHHDLVISSSSALAKGVITVANQPHIAYVNTPARYAWDLAPEYLRALESTAFGKVKSILAHRMMHKFRIWDQRTVPLVDHFIANSNFIATRIKKTYRRDAEVVYPPVDTDLFSYNSNSRDGYFVVISRLVSYKRIDLIVDAFNALPALQLKIIGAGPDLKRLKARAEKNIVFLGHLEQNRLISELQNARCFVFSAIEDFGISPVEAQSCGTPVICLGYGGTAETVLDYYSDKKDNATGVHFKQQTVQCIHDAIGKFLAIESELCPRAIRKNAERFSKERFRNAFSDVVERVVSGLS